jgi:hypothetical protein
MAMTIQQAQMEAMRLRARRPELQSMAVEDLISQIMATEGAEAPGAGGGLANLFPPKTLTPSSPAPMTAARLAAPKPTANIVPGAGVDSFRRAQQVRQRTERGPTPEERSAANANRQALVAEMRAGAPAPAPEAAPAAPVREASPVASALAAAEAPAKATYKSRFRPLLEQAEADLQQMNEQVALAVTPDGKPDPELSYNLKLKSGEVSRLKGMVAAEEGAAVDADRAALLERQAARLGREEELIDKARKRAPFDALIAGGAALAAAKPGENFASALARGLQAGSEKYTGARDAREAALRGIEEKRDTFETQRMDALESARNKAIELANAGVALTKEEAALINLKGEGSLAETLRPLKISAAESEAKTAKVSADYAERFAEADLKVKDAQARNYLETPAPKTGGSAGTKPSATVYNAISSQVNLLRKAINDPFVSKADKATYRAQLAQKLTELAYYGRLLGIGAPAPAAPAKAAKPAGRIVSSTPIK